MSYRGHYYAMPTLRRRLHYHAAYRIVYLQQILLSLRRHADYPHFSRLL